MRFSCSRLWQEHHLVLKALFLHYASNDVEGDQDAYLDTMNNNEIIMLAMDSHILAPAFTKEDLTAVFEGRFNGSRGVVIFHIFAFQVAPNYCLFLCRRDACSTTRIPTSGKSQTSRRENADYRNHTGRRRRSNEL